MRVSKPNISDTDRLSAFVRRLRRIEAHPLIASDGGELIRTLHDTQFKFDVHMNPDGTPSHTVQKVSLPDEVQFESLSARVRPMTVASDHLYHGKVMDALDALTDQTNENIVRANAKMRADWVKATERGKDRGTTIRAYSVLVGTDEDGDPVYATDLDLAYAWLYEDSVHGDIPSFDEFSARERYRAAAHVFSHIAVVALESLAYLRFLVDKGKLDLPPEVFTVDVVVTDPVWENVTEGFAGPPGIDPKRVMDLGTPPAGMQTLHEFLGLRTDDGTDEEFEATQTIGNRINAVAQMEQTIAEAEGVPPEVEERVDSLIDKLSSDDN